MALKTLVAKPKLIGYAIPIRKHFRLVIMKNGGEKKFKIRILSLLDPAIIRLSVKQCEK